jgi:hypothetical protein
MILKINNSNTNDLKPRDIATIFAHNMKFGFFALVFRWHQKSPILRQFADVFKSRPFVLNSGKLPIFRTVARLCTWLTVAKSG